MNGGFDSQKPQLEEESESSINSAGNVVPDRGKRVSKYAAKKVKRQKQGVVNTTSGICHLGIVSRFDVNKGFGFIRSNDVVLQDEQITVGQGINGSSIDLFVHKSDCQGELSPGEWVVFGRVVQKQKGRFKAKNVQPIIFDMQILRAALRYRGPFAEIKGIRASRKRIVAYEFNVIKQVLSKCIEGHYLTNDNVRIVLTEFISALPQDTWEENVDEIIRYVPIALEKVYLSEEYDVTDGDVVTVLFQRKLSRILFEREGIAAINKFPQWFDFRELDSEKLKDAVRRVENDGGALQVATRIGKGILASLFKEHDDASLSNAMRIALANVLDDITWISDFEPNDWGEFTEWLKACKSDTRIWFLWIYYDNRHIEFFDTHPITPLLDEDVRESFTAEFCENSVECLSHIELRNVLAAYCITEDIPRWERLSTIEFDIDSLVLMLNTRMNQWIQSNIKNIDRTVNALVAARGIDVTISALLKAQQLEDATLMYLYVLTGSCDLLNKLCDTNAAKEWLAAQSGTVVLKFLRQYLQSGIVDQGSTNDPILSDFSREKIVEAIQ